MQASHLPEKASYTPIEHYAIIGDCRSAALVSRDGSLDWLCLPRFDSPSIFAAILDAENGGSFQVQPIGGFSTERRYLANTNVLETVFRTPTGACVLRDLMPVSSEEDKRANLTTEHEVLRELEGLEGEVEVEIFYDPRPDYGRLRPVLKRRGVFGLQCEVDGATLTLRSELPLQVSGDDRSARGASKIRSGEHKYLSLTYSTEAPAVVPLLGEAARGRIDRTVRWWWDWASRCAYEGPYREAVVRSALTLKLMTYAPSGALVAAPTTSLPEWLGGVRNWDYRYCWLRDASFTSRALFGLGYREEAEAFLGWLLHATRLTWPELQVLYDVFGEANVPERELSWLEGYASSRPVRIGNDAQGQLQLDVYGEVIDAAAQFLDRGGRFDRDTSRMLEGLGRTVCGRWREPDEGIWEGRSGRFHHTHSKTLCWVALDRLIKMHEAGHLEVSVELFRTIRDEIRRDIEAHGYNGQIGSYTRTLDGEEMDASLLTLPHYGYIGGKHPRMRSTCASIHEKLASDRLIYRYESDTDDGLPPGEGAFGICSFWAVECVARGGDVEGAKRAFDRVLSHANDVGLFAEENRSRDRRSLRELPTGVHPHRPHKRGAYVGRAPAAEHPVNTQAATNAEHRGGNHMNKRGVSLWGFVGTVVLTTLMAGSQRLGLSRINFPFMLGTIFTPDRDRAKLIGFGVHFVNGWIFASVYAAAFESWRRATWWLGAAIGLVHALYVLAAAMPAMPAMHPRMASEQQGPTPTKQLEPPGFMALNYGRRTPISVIASHVMYGAVLGAFYRPKQEG